MFEIKGKYGKATVHIDNVDETTISQIYKFVNHPFFKDDIHIMPDTHAGKGAVIGFTMPLHGLEIIPNIIGVDVNCGMIAVRIENLTARQINKFSDKNFIKPMCLSRRLPGQPYVTYGMPIVFIHP